MKPSQKIWDPLAYYPSSYYRYITAEEMLKTRSGEPQLRRDDGDPLLDRLVGRIRMAPE